MMPDADDHCSFLMKTAPATSVQPTRVRHVVLGITVAVYMITYMDRVIISTALPVMRQELGFSLITAGWILSSFRWAYALFQIPGGWLGDRIGPRRALTLIVSWWSAFTVLTGLAWSATAMIVTQLFFGMGEAGAFPIATRSLSRWMLPSERGHAQGVTHAGSRLGAAFTRPLAVFLIAAYGWRSPFFAFGGLGLLWAALWFSYYRDSPEQHRGVNAQERELIHSATGGPRSKVGAPVPWRKILSSPTLWALCLMYACYQYGLVVYLDWFPTYLKESRGLTLGQMGVYSSLPLFACCSGRSRRGLAQHRSAPPPHWRHPKIASPRGNRRFLDCRRSYHSGHTHRQSQAVRGAELPGVRWTGIDGRRLVGDSARYRGRFRGFRRGAHEHGRQYRGRDHPHLGSLPGDAVWLECTLYDRLSAVSGGGGDLWQDRRKQAYFPGVR